MPWEQEMLVKRAQEEAVAMGLPPTPSKEVIARAFGDRRMTRTRTCGAPRRQTQTRRRSPKEAILRRRDASARATRPTGNGNDAVPASAARRAAIAAAGSDDRTAPAAAAPRPASARANASRPTSARRRSPYAAAAVPGFVAAHARQTAAAAIPPSRKLRLRRRRRHPRRRPPRQ